jgi:hypothetical protein
VSEVITSQLTNAHGNIEVVSTGQKHFPEIVKAVWLEFLNYNHCTLYNNFKTGQRQLSTHSPAALAALAPTGARV